MFRKAFLAILLSVSIFVVFLYVVFSFLISGKDDFFDEKFILTSSETFIDVFLDYKIFNFCGELEGKEYLEMKKYDTKMKGKNLFVCKTNFSQKLTPDFAYFHNVKTIQEIKDFRIDKAEIDYKDNVNEFLAFVKKNGILDYTINYYDYDNDLQKTFIDIEFGNFAGKSVKKEIDCDFCEGNSNLEGDRVVGIFFGDTHFGRGFEYFMRAGLKKEEDYFVKFYEDENLENNLEEKIHRRLYGFDFVGLNLETAVAEENECQQSNKSIVLKTLPKFLQSFKDVGFEYFNLANNHSMDCGKTGYEATKKHLDSFGLKYFGDMGGETLFLKEQVGDIKIAFMGINDTFWNIKGAEVDYKAKVQKIKDLKNLGYKVIINIHWGVEYKLQNNDRQKRIAEQLVEAGADLIIGHHPHVVQNYEIINGVPVIYSLGNFVFDQPFENTIKGMAIAFEIAEKGIRFKPIYFFRDNKRYFVSEFEK